MLPLCERLRQVVLGASCFLMLCYLIYVGCFTGRISLWDAASRKVRLGFAVAGVGVRTSPVYKVKWRRFGGWIWLVTMISTLETLPFLVVACAVHGWQVGL